jgi:hypothetical protein
VDFLGDALRKQGKDPSQLKLILNAVGMHGFSAPGLEIFDGLSGAVPPTNIMQIGDCMGDALRLQHKCNGHLKFNLNSGDL